MRALVILFRNHLLLLRSSFFCFAEKKDSGNVFLIKNLFSYKKIFALISDKPDVDKAELFAQLISDSR